MLFPNPTTRYTSKKTTKLTAQNDHRHNSMKIARIVSRGNVPREWNENGPHGWSAGFANKRQTGAIMDAWDQSALWRGVNKHHRRQPWYLLPPQAATATTTTAVAIAAFNHHVPLLQSVIEQPVPPDAFPRTCKRVVGSIDRDGGY